MMQRILRNILLYNDVKYGIAEHMFTEQGLIVGMVYPFHYSSVVKRQGSGPTLRWKQFSGLTVSPTVIESSGKITWGIIALSLY